MMEINIILSKKQNKLEILLKRLDCKSNIVSVTRKDAWLQCSPVKDVFCVWEPSQMLTWRFLLGPAVSLVLVMLIVGFASNSEGGDALVRLL